MICGKEVDMVLGLEEYLYSELSEDNIESVTSEIEEMNETLSFIADNPLDINTATREQLENLPFLKHSQVENLMEYIFDYGPLKSLYELSFIEGFDRSTIRALIPFITIKNITKESKFSFKNVFKYGKSHLTVNSGGTLQKKEGYTNGKYLGKPYSLYFKYYFKHRDMSFGFLGSKSEGEPFDFIYNKGFDFYSAHIFFSNLSKHIKTLVIGDYKMVFGQGLVFKSNSNFSNTSIENTIVSSDIIKPSYSTSETGYYRGGAIQIGNKNITFSLLSSFTFYNKNEGYHRTESDFEKRYKSRSYMLGSNINFSWRYFKIGISGYYDFYDKCFNAGIDYKFKIGKFRFSGETALDRNLKLATINSFTVICNDLISLSALIRYYPLGYYTKYGNAYTKNSITDETGFYIGAEISPFKNTKFEIFSDIYRISFIKYNIYKPSVGFKFNFKAIYNPNENNLGYIRYSVNCKEKNLTSNNLVKKTCITYKHNLTFNYKFSIKESFNINATLSASFFTVDSLNKIKSTTNGYLVSSYGTWHTLNSIISISAGAAFFDIPYYDNAIYNYEPSVHYSYSSPQYYGIGARFFILLKISPVKNMTIDFKISNTYYIDRDEIGSGNEKIHGNDKTVINGVFSYKF